MTPYNNWSKLTKIIWTFIYGRYAAEPCLFAAKCTSEKCGQYAPQNVHISTFCGTDVLRCYRARVFTPHPAVLFHIFRSAPPRGSAQSFISDFSLLAPAILTCYFFTVAFGWTAWRKHEGANQPPYITNHSYQMKIRQFMYTSQNHLKIFVSVTRLVDQIFKNFHLSLDLPMYES
jgi:hypothetical protein